MLGTDAKPLLVGDAARRAVTFARAAKAGLTGPEDAFENERGFLKLLNRGVALEDELETIGRRWRLCDPGLLFKTSPVCSAALSAIEQMNALMAELGASADEVAGVHAEVPELVYESLVFPNPSTPQEMQFSLPYALACAALHGRVRFEDLAHSIVISPNKGRHHGAGEREARPGSVHRSDAREIPRKHPPHAQLKGRPLLGRVLRVARGMPERPAMRIARKFRVAGAYAGISLPRVERGL